MPIILAPLRILDEVASDIYASMKSAAGVTRDAFVRSMEIGFRNYLTQKHRRYAKTHTLLSPHEPLDVDQIYVDPSFSIGEKSYQGDHIFEVISEEPIIVVQAIAGQGKSMLIRHIFCRYCEVNYGLVPIMIELRDVDFTKVDIIDVAYGELKHESNSFSKEAFEAILRSGKVIFLLDGFDEIKTDQRKNALRQIDDLSKKFSRCKVIITSRPSDIFGGWNTATIIEIMDYELPQIISLIERSPIAREVKDAFCTKVKNEYIFSHEKFLSNPLLCNMMILTFMRGGDIPSQQHIFYRKAFETLYKHHDDMKFLYKRDYHSDLPEDQFVRLWRAFCYFSYIDRRFSFEKEILKTYITRASEYIETEVDAEDISLDFVESLCILVKDGDSYSFLHRSFQEYAVAAFITTERISGYVDIIERLIHNVHDDDVLHLAFQMNRELVEQEYILKRVDELLTKLKGRSTMKKKISLFYTGLSLEPVAEGEDGVFFQIGGSGGGRSDLYFNTFVRRSYKKTFDREISRKLVSWMREMRPIGSEKEKRARFQIDIKTVSEEMIANSPVANVVEHYRRCLEEVRQEIRDRQRHQRNMLRLPG